jgi:hypothetical protein
MKKLVLKNNSSNKVIINKKKNRKKMNKKMMRIFNWKNNNFCKFKLFKLDKIQKEAKKLIIKKMIILNDFLLFFF